ncbi:hypothetical protein Q3C01_38990 [Bradyrhizobium sp. UFLA05-109]
MNSLKPAEGHGKLLRAWQLAILRFAITLDDADRFNVAGLAAELDRLGRRDSEDSPHFFRRTSSQLCAAISGQQQNADAILKRFFNQIDEPRLRLAFAAAVGTTRSDAGPPAARPKRNRDLFRGLPAQRTAPL